MSILQEIQQKATTLKRQIVLPEGEDPRTIEAAKEIKAAGIANVTLLGNQAKVEALAADVGLSLTAREVVDPAKSDLLSEFAEILFNKRKHKGLTLQQAREMVQHVLYFGALLVETGRAHGSVAGAAHTTGDVIKAGLHCLGMQEGIDVVSSSFMMVFPDGRVYTYSDGAVIPDPTAEQLPSICKAATDTHKKLTGTEPKAAFLSFSTRGSADHPLVDKVRTGFQLTKEKYPELIVDGELQIDAAIIPAIAQRKAPDSPLAGQANVFIFPDLNAGNIAYKITERLAGAEAIGPVVQGLKKPFLDLSRGAKASDIVNVVAIAALL